jgi:hypothetical protein
VQTDRFRRFILGWTALEILVGKVFSFYERLFVATLVRESGMAGAEQYFERVTDVMKSRYRLADKFSVIAGILAGEDGYTDVEEFKRIKKMRDDLVHGENIPETSLPTEELQVLLGKYLQQHLDRINSR